MKFFMNKAGGAQHNREHAYRTVVRIGSAQGSLPPVCFFTTAIRVLIGDPGERVLMLVEGDVGWGLARSIVEELTKLQPSGTTTEPWFNAKDIKPWYNASQALAIRFTDDSERQPAILGALRLASRVVWFDAATTPLSTVPRRKPFEVVWTWCPGRRREANDEGRGCPRLSTSVTDFHVQGRARAAAATSADDKGASNCSRLVTARSSWSDTKWHDLSYLVPPVRAEFLRGEWMHENVCLGYSGPSPSRGSQRWSILAQAHGPSRQVMWPLPWPDMYAEYIPGWLRLDSATADHYLTNMVNMSDAAPHAPLRQCTWHDEKTSAFLTEVTMDNLYHALIHAVPVRELFERLRPSMEAGGGKVHILPHYTQYWPKNFTRSVGWQILARSLGVSSADFPSIAAHAQALTSLGGCNCYRRMYGGHSKFMPPPFMKPERRVADFRAALSASVGPMPAQRRILFQLRHNGVRQMINEAEVVAGVSADPVVGKLVKFVVMESLTVLEQYALISTSRGLAGMHGMGLAWAMLLASEAGGKASCLEITGMWSKFNRLDYVSMSKANGVQYLRLSMPNAPECIHCHRCSYRTCGNVTANVTNLIGKLIHMTTLWKNK